MRIEMLTFVVSALLFQCHRTFANDSRNIALNKPATQVSTSGYRTNVWSASRAVDGDKTCGDPPTWQHYSATRPGKTTAWWRVDLQREYYISKVVVHGKPTDTNNQLTGFRLYLTEKPEDIPHSSSLVYTNHAYNNGVFDIPTSKVARYCMLSLPGANKAIVLCEVEVYGTTHKEQYKNLNIFISNSSMETVNGSLVFSGNPNNGLYTFTLPFKPPISFRYLTIRRLTVGVMTICEVKHIEANLNLCDRLRPIAITSQSSIFAGSSDYQSSNAIDGLDSYDIDHCRCCSVTKATPSPSWWQIDLRNKYTVDKVEIFGRQSDAHEQLEHAKLYAGNISMETDSYIGHLLYTVPAITDTSHFVHPLQSSVTAQFFIIRLKSNILTLCEFKLYEKEEECDVGRFGAACSLKCHCADGRICNSLTGECQTPRCLPGWTGQACDRECHVGHYGNGCARRCNCLNDTKCNSVTGHCYLGECKPGWQGDACDQVCDERKFGKGCNTTCNCLIPTLCDPVNGSCHIQECDPGWYGPSCSDPCMTSAFGFQCNKTCHCINGSKCDHISGYCELSRCDPGWMGETCSDDKNILGTRKEQVKTSMSTTAHNWTSDLAIDGDVGPDPDVCHCCSGTQNSQTSWWMVDMGKRYPVNHITVFNRNNEQLYQQLTGFQLYLANGSDPLLFMLIRNSTERILDNRHEITFPSTVTRYVKIQRPGVLTLCEVLVYEGECQLGTFGDECSQICHCADERSCDAETGQCQSPACKTGWIGLACNKLEIINKQNESDVYTSSEHRTTTEIGTDVHTSNEHKTTTEIGADVHTSSEHKTTTGIGAAVHARNEHKPTTEIGAAGHARNEHKLTTEIGAAGHARNEHKPTTEIGAAGHARSEHKTTTEIGAAGHARSEYKTTFVIGTDVDASSEHKPTTEIGTDVHASSEHKTTAVVAGAVGGSVAVVVVIVAISVMVFRSRKRNRYDDNNDYATPNLTHAQIETEYDTLEDLNDNKGQSNNSCENERVSSF